MNMIQLSLVGGALVTVIGLIIWSTQKDKMTITKGLRMLAQSHGIPFGTGHFETPWLRDGKPQRLNTGLVRGLHSPEVDIFVRMIETTAPIEFVGIRVLAQEVPLEFVLGTQSEPKLLKEHKSTALSLGGRAPAMATSPANLRKLEDTVNLIQFKKEVEQQAGCFSAEPVLLAMYGKAFEVYIPAAALLRRPTVWESDFLKQVAERTLALSNKVYEIWAQKNESAESAGNGA